MIVVSLLVALFACVGLLVAFWLFTLMPRAHRTEGDERHFTGRAN